MLCFSHRHSHLFCAHFLLLFQAGRSFVCSSSSEKRAQLKFRFAQSLLLLMYFMRSLRNTSLLDTKLHSAELHPNCWIFPCSSNFSKPTFCSFFDPQVTFLVVKRHPLPWNMLQVSQVNSNIRGLAIWFWLITACEPTVVSYSSTWDFFHFFSQIQGRKKLLSFPTLFKAFPLHCSLF